jgi:hypothetical protein
MTGPSTHPSSILTRERPALNLPKDIAGLRAECKRRKIETAGNKQEVRALPSQAGRVTMVQSLTADNGTQLITRLHSHEPANSRAFSSAVEGTRSRPSPSATSTSTSTTTTQQKVRHFNTTRSLKAVGDNSTMDFAYLPDMQASEAAESADLFRVPIISADYSEAARIGPQAPVVEEPVSLLPNPPCKSSAPLVCLLTAFARSS